MECGVILIGDMDHEEERSALGNENRAVRMCSLNLKTHEIFTIRVVAEIFIFNRKYSLNIHL